MPTEGYARCGPVIIGEGTPASIRLTRDGAVAAVDAHGRYYESASRGTTYIAGVGSAGILISALTTVSTTQALTLANPIGSLFNISILKLVFSWTSGTLGSGTLWWVQGANPGTMPTETGVRMATRLTGSLVAPGDVALAYTFTNMTNLPTIVRPSTVLFAPYAGTTNAMAPSQIEDVAGELVVPPGRYVGLSPVFSGGTSPTINLSITYELVPQ